MWAGELCCDVLGSPVRRQLFARTGVGEVVGVELEDGRRVVLKRHRARWEPDFLAAVAAAQELLATSGFPAPRPLHQPHPTPGGTVTFEAWLGHGDHPEGRDPEDRGAMARGLAELVERCRGLALPANPMDRPRGALWPAPHDPIIDLRTPGGEWIDAIAKRALAVATTGPVVLGHTDWSGQNLRIAEGRLSAVYDWTSLAYVPEPALAGMAAHGFTANWELRESEQHPTRDEALGFLGDYERARGRFSADERRTAVAALVWTMGYTARCEHSRAPDAPGGRRTARAFLRAHADELLGR